jgi:F-type H+-transporting ATPase subunit g
MATQRLAQLATHAKKIVEPVYKAARSETVHSYEQMMKANAEYVVSDPVAAEKLAKQWFYTKMSQVPGGIKASEAELGQLKGKLRNWKDLSAQEMGVLLAFGAELFAWFSIGEIVGRGGSITGYDI